MEKKTDFKALSNKAKVQYIWDYYRLHIIVGVAAVLIIGSVIHHFVTYREPLLNVIMINTSSGEATSSDGFNEFLDLMDMTERTILFRFMDPCNSQIQAMPLWTPTPIMRY